MRIAVICDNGRIKQWQRLALAAIGGHRLFLLNCTNSRYRRRPLRHFGYYLINLMAMRHRLTRSVPIEAAAIAFADRRDFQSGWQGAWQLLPDDVVGWMKAREIDAVVKFGMGLLVVPEEAASAAPILSFHHGDPREFRGRPAGFYELLLGRPFMGQIVQLLSNRLDAGEVLAFAETRVHAHSYRATLIEAYRHSPPLLGRALAALAGGERLPFAPEGRNYRLPGNGTALRFVAQRLAALARRLLYGAFTEKRWRVSLAPLPRAGSLIEDLGALERARDEWRTPSPGRRYSFFADPFFHGDDDSWLVEGLDRRSGQGELVRIVGEDQQRLEGPLGHCSYPASVGEGGETFVVPEVQRWSPPIIYRRRGARLEPVAKLEIGDERLTDPTFIRRASRLYLFANRRQDGASVLNLWSAESLFGRFERHPQSPIRVSARGSRMAGELVERDGALYRLGQDFVSGYGDGVLLFRILRLDPDHYAEEQVGTFAFGGVKGPHTINFRENQALFDWYVDRFAPLAGFRRLRARWSRV